jgi:hypothetical protein
VFFQSPSKKEFRTLRALDQITALINLRESLAAIRANKMELAINDMEMCIDCGVTMLLSEIGGCDAVTKDLMAQEFRRLWLYRKDPPGYPSSYFDKVDAALRENILQRRAKVEEILKQYAT